MAQKRFLRDNALDNMVQEIQVITERLSSRDFPGFIFSKSLESLSEMYETNKAVLSHLEDAIESLRNNEPKNEEALDSIVNAASHVQLGLVSIHNSLKEDVNMLMQQINDLKDTLGLNEDEDSPYPPPGSF